MPIGTYPGTSAYGGPPPGGGIPPVQIKAEISASEESDEIKLRQQLPTKFRMCAQQAAKLDPTVSGVVTYEAEVKTNGKLQILQSKSAPGLANFDTCVRKVLGSVNLLERQAAATCHFKITLTAPK